MKSPAICTTSLGQVAVNIMVWRAQRIRFTMARIYAHR
jgi:hypothetical protein